MRCDKDVGLFLVLQNKKAAPISSPRNNLPATLPAMQKVRYLVLLIPLLIFLPFVLSRQSPQVKTANRLHEQYLAAEAPVLRPDSGVREAERFLGALKAIDTDAAPKDVQLAMTKLTVAVEANLHTRESGGDVDAANDRVADARNSLIRALDKWRGQPF